MRGWGNEQPQARQRTRLLRGTLQGPPAGAQGHHLRGLHCAQADVRGRHIITGGQECHHCQAVPQVPAVLRRSAMPSLREHRQVSRGNTGERGIARYVMGTASTAGMTIAGCQH